MIRVLALGDSEIQIGRKKITLSTEAVFALGLYLVLRAGERLSRDEVVETFWGAHEPTKGRHSLRQMLYRLRQKGFQLDLETAEELYLDPERVECDLAQVLAEEWPETADALQVDAAGRPIPTFSRRYSDHFQEWYDEIRSRVARQHRRGALRQIALARREGRWSDLELWAQHVLQSDPLNEEATLARAESAAMAGSKTMALEILDQYMEELGDRATQIGLPAKVLRKRIAERRPEWGVRGAREVALVGREELMARLTAMVDAAGRGDGQAIVLWGAPGVGKTRLAAEMTEYAELEGFLCTRAPTTQGSLAQPNATIMELVPLLTALPGAAGCHPASLALLERAGRTYRDASPLEPPRTDTTLEDSIARALLDLTQAVSIERKLLVLVDDLQCTDTRSLQTLEFLFARASASRVLWVATSRVRPAHNGSPDSPARAFLVPPLSEVAATELAEFVCDHNRLYLADFDHLRIAQAAGGNPLFVRELTLHSAQTAHDGPLPRSLRAVMHERLSRLNPQQTHILRLISLLGAHSHVSTLLSITGLSSTRLTSSLEDLEFEGMVRLTPTRSLSLHDCWQTTVLEGTSPIVRAALALECAQALDATPESVRSESCDWRAAELFSQAGDSERSLPLFARVADRMYARGLSNDAATILERALQSGGTDRPLLALRARYARALFGSGRLHEVLVACDAGLAFRVPKEADQRGAYASLACLRLDALAKLRKDHRAALAVVASLATDEELPSDARQLACLTGIVVAFNDTTSGYEDVFHEASEAASRSHQQSVMGCLVHLIHSAEHGDQRRVEESEVVLQELEREPIAEHLRCRALRTRAMAQRFAGNVHRAFQLGTIAFEAGQQSGLMGEAALAAEHMTFAALDYEDASQLALWLERWDACGSAHAYFERSRARVHAACRISISQNQFEDGLAHYRTGNDDAVDPLGKRRAVDDAALCRCLAALGRREESLSLGASSLSVYASCRASSQIDYVVDSVLCAFAAIGERERFDVLAHEYLSRRSTQYPFPIAPAFRELRRASDGRFDGRQTGCELLDDETRIGDHRVV